MTSLQPMLSVTDFTDFKQECVTNWTKLFATNEVQFTDSAIDNFLAFVDHLSCSADTYVSLGGSNGCADQLTNWDGTQKVGLGTQTKKGILKSLTSATARRKR